MRWRKRIGEEGVEWLLTKTIKAGRSSGTITDKALKRVPIDTTVIEKNIAHPTNARLYVRARALLVSLAKKAARSFPGNPYDGHTLAPALEQVEILTDTRPSLAVVDCGYRGNGVETTRVLISGQWRGITPVLAKPLKRRSAIDPEIGHMKSDGRLARCPLMGRIGDAIFALLCACGHNIRKILAHIRALWAVVIHFIRAIVERTDGSPRGLSAA